MTTTGVPAQPQGGTAQPQGGTAQPQGGTAQPREGTAQPLAAEEMAAWHAFIRAHARVVRLLEAELEAEQGLTLPAYEVLAHLSEAPDRRLRMSDLAAMSVVTPSGLTRVVDRLVREGLVERQRCPGDARVVYAALTDSGLDRVSGAYPTHLRGVRAHLIDRLSTRQLTAIREALEPLTADCPSVHPR